jgi:hypothetical protein
MKGVGTEQVGQKCLDGHKHEPPQAPNLRSCPNYRVHLKGTKVLDFVRLDGGIEPEGVTRTKDHRRVTVGVSIWPALAGLTPH